MTRLASTPSADPFDPAISEAARRFFAAHPDADAARALGLDDLLVSAASDGERALHLACIGLEAGSSHYTGALAEDCLACLSGLTPDLADLTGCRVATLRAHPLPTSALASGPFKYGVTLRGDPSLTLEGRISSVPHLGGARALLVLALHEGIPVLVWLDLKGAQRCLQSATPPGCEASEPGSPARDQTCLQLMLRTQLDGSDLGDVCLQNHPMHAQGILAQGLNAGQAIHRLSQFAWLVTAARLVGCASRALQLTRDHLMLRQQFGRPLAGFQALQHRLASLFVDIQVSKSLLQQVASSWEDEQDRRDTLLHALKSKASRVALSAAKSAVHLHGAMGYCDEHEVGRLLKHVMVLSARDGTSAEHRRAFSQSAPRLFKTPE